MKNLKKLLGLITILTITVSAAKAQQILAFKFTYDDNGKQSTSKSTSINDNLEPSILSRGAGAANVKASCVAAMVAVFAPSNNMDEAIKNDAYYEFFVKAKPGFKFSLKSLKATMRVQETSANTYRWRFSIDGGKTFTDVGTDAVTITNLDNNGSEQPIIDLSKVAQLQNIQPDKKVIFRLYAWGGKSDNPKSSAFGLGKTVGNYNNVISVAGYVSVAK